MNQHGALASSYWRRTTQVLWGTPVPVPLRQPQTSYGQVWDRTWASDVNLATNRPHPVTAPNFGTKLHPNIHVVSKALRPADIYFTTPRQTTPKILVTHDTDTVALHSVFWMTSQVMLQKRYTVPRYVRPVIQFTNHWEWDTTIIDFFTASMQWLGCPYRVFSEWRIEYAWQIHLARCSLASQLQTSELHATWSSTPFSFPVRTCVRACVRGWTIGILIGGLCVENQENIFP